MAAVIKSNLGGAEEKAYLDYIENKYNRKVQFLTIEEDGEFVNLSYQFESVPFERIRRITGYLVGTMDHWNDAKTAEEKDRITHQLEEAAQMERLGA